MSGQNLQAWLLAELQALFGPLLAARNSVDQERLLARLGWVIDEADEDGLPLTELFGAITALITVIEEVEALVQDPPESLEDTVRLLDGAVGVAKLIQHTVAFAEQLDTTDLPEELAELGEDLLLFLVYRYLEVEHPLVLWLLALVGLAELETELVTLTKADGEEVLRHASERPRLRLDRLERLFTDPIGLWAALYMPPSGALAMGEDVHHLACRVFPQVARILRYLGLDARYGVLPYDGVDMGTSAEVARDMLFIAWRARLDQAAVGASLALDSQDRGGGLGLVITPFGAMQLTEQIGLWAITLTASADVGSFAFGPKGFVPPAGLTDGHLDLRLGLQRLPDPSTGSHAAWLAGSATGTRLEIGRLELLSHLYLGDGRDDVGLMAAVREAALVIAPGDGDGFLAKILPKDGLTLGFELALGYSLQRGFHFSGGVSEDSAIELKLPVDLDLFGVLQVEDVRLRIAPETSPPGVSMAASAVVHTHLGPLSATVEGMGLSAALTFPPGGGGNLGPADLELGFKPPTGVALSVDASVVKGGGYLSFGEHRYTGVLQLALFEKITINAIGILTTQLPGGERGFSLFILISVVFDPGIQVGMGFSITGLGGLLGLNRGMNPQGLRAGVRDGRVGDVLFPKDPLKNAPAVISSIESFFPVQKGRFVFGPVFRLSWGTPAIINLEMGLVLEVPAPVRVALPGVLRMALPDPSDPILQLNVAFLGLVDFGEKYISIDASIFDSRILSFTLSGDMAFRLRWGRNPYFLYSVGGFHPLFQPPEGLGLRGMRRLRVDILNSKQLKLGLETYFALTSNTVQFGAKADFKAKMGIFKARAETGFDALFVFNPFHMDVSIWFLAALSVGEWEILAVSVDARLTGPTPWFFKGTATLTFLGEELDVAVEHSWGEEKDTAVEAVDARAQLVQALEDAKNWQAKSPSGRAEGVTLRATAALAEDGLVMQPGGTLEVTQQVLPLDRDIDKLGAAPIAGARRFSLEEAALLSDGARVPLAVRPLHADFAPAQFQEMREAEKLSAPSFVPMAAGLSMQPAGGGLAFGGRRRRQRRVEQVLIDQDERRLAASSTVALDHAAAAAEEVAS